MTLKKAILRGLIGIPIGVFISTTIGLIISLIYGELSVVSNIGIISNPLTAYTFQYIISIVLGFTFAAGSAIFEVDSWSLAKQSIIHFLLSSLVYLPCAIIAGWVPVKMIAILYYFITFISIYIMIWAIQYFVWKDRIKKLNQKLASK